MRQFVYGFVSRRLAGQLFPQSRHLTGENHVSLRLQSVIGRRPAAISVLDDGPARRPRQLDVGETVDQIFARHSTGFSGSRQTTVLRRQTSLAAAGRRAFGRMRIRTSQHRLYAQNSMQRPAIRRSSWKVKLHYWKRVSFGYKWRPRDHGAALCAWMNMHEVEWSGPRLRWSYARSVS